jgi:transporter family-2 protein
MQFHQSILVLCAIATGAMIPFQAGANAILGRTLGHPLWGTASSLGVSLACIVPIMLTARVASPELPNLAPAPWWIWLGGIIGAFYLTGALLIAPRLGAAGFIGAVIAGQMLASLVIDRWGLIGFPQRPISMQRLFGFAVICFGFALMQLPSMVSSTNSE